LKNTKKEFISLCKLKPPKDKTSIGDAFLEFLNCRIERE
jgi:hypothetical protein